MQAIDSVLPFRPGLRGDRPKPIDPGPPPSPRGPARPGHGTVHRPQPPHRQPPQGPIDGILRPRPAPQPIRPSIPFTPRPIAATTSPASAAVAAPNFPLTLPQTHTPSKPFPLRLPQSTIPATRGTRVFSFVIIGVLAVMLVATRPPFGQVLVTLYAIVALYQRIPSRFTFIGGLGTLGLTLVALVLMGGQSSAPGALAICAFLLFTIGTITLGIELRNESAAKQA